MNRTYHHGNLRAALVEAGVALARDGGPSAVVLRAVSRRAEVSHNAAYRHFTSHGDLLAAVASSCMERLGQLMISRTAAVGPDDPVPRAWARLEAIGLAYLDFARTEPGWFRTAFAGAAPGTPKRVDPHVTDPHVTDRQVTDPHVTDPGADPYALLAARLDELVDVGAIPADRRPGAEYAAWSAVHGLSSLLVDGPLRDLPDAEVRLAARTVLAVISRGL
ncbi:TetR/AcrR family transcriptional regulator [Kitasatospora sp. NPDC057015]|uniref:TetR/AcrR family transcriptional regulator n=1 Tax=Kitasatospora sp. NPDC057015 TaxID=3346001 RepID=UPI00363BA9FD